MVGTGAAWPPLSPKGKVGKGHFHQCQQKGRDVLWGMEVEVSSVNA